MTGDGFRKLLLSAALAAERRLRRVILRLSEKAPAQAPEAGNGPAEAPAPELEQAGGQGGPPKHWLDRVRKHAPELLLPAQPRSIYHDPDAADRMDGQSPREGAVRGRPAQPVPGADGDRIHRGRKDRAGASPGGALADVPGSRPGDTIDGGAGLGSPAGTPEASGRRHPDDEASGGESSEEGIRGRGSQAGAEAGMKHLPMPPIARWDPGPEGAGEFDPSAGKRRGMARGPEGVPGREAASVSGRQPRVGVESTADETAAADTVRSRATANVAEIASAQQPTGGGHAERAAGNIDFPAVSSTRRDSVSGDVVDDARTRTHSREMPAPLEGTGGRDAPAGAKKAFSQPAEDENRRPEARGYSVHPTEAAVFGSDKGRAEWAEPSWPALPDEDPSERAGGFERSGPWPLLMEESRVLAEKPPDRSEPSELRAAIRNIERLARLDREQAGKVWNVWPF